MSLQICPKCSATYGGMSLQTQCSCGYIFYSNIAQVEPLKLSFSIDEIEDLLATLEHEYISKEHELANEAIRKMQIFVERNRKINELAK